MNYLMELDSIVELESIENARSRRKDFSFYQYNGINVPRVTKVISDCNNTEWLIKWACGLGWYGYLREKDFATSVGSYVHEMIEHYIKTGEDLKIDIKETSKQAFAIDRAYANFKSWYMDLLNNGYSIEILGIEVPVITPYYAGTLDCICRLRKDGYESTLILDFKTSRKIEYGYLVQLAAYYYAVNNGYCEIKTHVDGVGIIRVDKEATYYEDLFIMEANNLQMLNYYVNGWFSILSTYYNKINMEYTFNQYKKNYTGIDNVTNNLVDTSITP